MCDPVFQDCPTEDPTGPSITDLPKEKPPTHDDAVTFTDSEIFNANLTLDAAMTVVIIYWVLDTFTMKKMAYYTLTVETTYPALIGTSATNFWKLANMIHGYGGLAILGTAYLFQLLATFGIAKNLNYLIWYYLVGFGGMLFDNTYMVLLYLAYDAAHKLLTDNTKRASAMTITD